MTLLCKLCILIFYSTLFLHANDKKTIIWDIPIEPPITYVKNDIYLGYGIKIMKDIQSYMPKYNHKIRVAGNYKRLSKDIVEGPLTCALGLFKTQQRLKNMYFANVPVFSFFDLQIVLTRDTFKILGEPESLSLSELLNKKDFRLGISNGRAYSTKIRAILNKNKKNTNIKIFTQDNVTSSLLNMLVRNRFHYTFLYPDEAMYYSKNIKISKNIVTVPIAEIEDYGHSWVACTKNESGYIVTTKVTGILQKIRKDSKYIKYYNEYISSNLHEYYEKHFFNTFIKIYEE